MFRSRSRSILIGSCLWAAAGCSSPLFTPADEASIRERMDEQTTAWNNGDIHGFMAAYADSTCLIGPSGRTCGKEVLEERYKKRYPDPEAMGRLDFGDVEVLGAGADHAWCTGRWRTLRTMDTLSGGFSLFWVRTPHGWRILRDHTY